MATRISIRNDSIRKGDDAKANKDYERARQLYTEAMKIDEEDVANDPSGINLYSLSIVYNRLASLAEETEKYDEAFEWYERSRSLCEKAVQKENTPERHYQLSVCYDCLAFNAESRADVASAERYLSEALEQVQDFFGNNDAKRYWAEVPYYLHRLAKAASDRDALELAQSRLELALDILSQIIREEATVECLREKAEVLICYGNFYKDKQHDIAMAWTCYDEALELREQVLVEQSDRTNRGRFERLCNSLRSLAKERREGLREEMYRCYYALHDEGEQDTTECLCRFSASINALADEQVRYKHYERAREWYRKAGARLLYTPDTHEQKAYREIRHAFEGEVLASEKLEDHDGMIKAAQQWMAYSKTFYAQNKSRQALRGLAVAEAQLGWVYMLASHWQSAQEALSSMEQTMEQLYITATADHTAEELETTRRELCAAYRIMLCFYKNCEDGDGIERYLHKIRALGF